MYLYAGFIIGGIGGFGVTGGAHRYFTHRSFKANLPLQIILIACYTVSGQVCYEKNQNKNCFRETFVSW